MVTGGGGATTVRSKLILSAQHCYPLHALSLAPTHPPHSFDDASSRWSECSRPHRADQPAASRSKVIARRRVAPQQPRPTVSRSLWLCGPPAVSSTRTAARRRISWDKQECATRVCVTLLLLHALDGCALIGSADRCAVRGPEADARHGTELRCDCDAMRTPSVLAVVCVW